MKVENLTVSNFENLGGLWQFGQVNELRGRNGSGKSALGRAMGWCFTGLDAFGDRRTDHVLRDVQQPAEVVMRLADGRTVTRRKTLHSTTLLVNGAPVDLDYFGDPHLLLSSLMPGYFLTLDEKQKRQLFMQLLPPVDMADLFMKRTDMNLKVQEAMGIDFRQDPAKLHKRWSTTRLAKQKDFMQLVGAKEELELRVQELDRCLKEAQGKADSLDLDTLESEGRELAEELQRVRKDEKTWQEWTKKREVYEAKLEDRKRYQDQIDKALDGLTLEQLTKQLEAVSAEIERLEEIKERHQDWKNEMENWKEAKASHAEALDFLDNRQCFICQHALDQKEVKAIRKRLLDCEEPGDEPAKLKDGALEKIEKERQALADRVQLAREYSGFLKSRPLPEEPGKEPCELPAQGFIDQLEEKLAQARERYTSAKASAQAVQDALAQQLESAKQDLKANEQLRTDLEGQVDRLQAVEAALHPASGVFADALNKQLETVRELLPAWEFELSETTKTTGNERPCFKEYLDVPVTGDPGRFWRVPLRYCSAGQQLRAGVDLCRALDHLNGDKLGMVFVDNVELLSRELPLHGDVQEFRCVVEDHDLKVEVLVEA